MAIISDWQAAFPEGQNPDLCATRTSRPQGTLGHDLQDGIRNVISSGEHLEKIQTHHGNMSRTSMCVLREAMEVDGPSMVNEQV